MGFGVLENFLSAQNTGEQETGASRAASGKPKLLFMIYSEKSEEGKGLRIGLLFAFGECHWPEVRVSR